MVRVIDVVSGPHRFEVLEKLNDPINCGGMRARILTKAMRRSIPKGT